MWVHLGTKDKHLKLQRIEPSLTGATYEKESAKRLTKFWQTPSPNRDHSDRSKESTKMNSKDIPIQDFQNFLNQIEDIRE